MTSAAQTNAEEAQLAVPSLAAHVIGVNLNTAGAALAIAGSVWWDRRRPSVSDDASD